MSVYRCLRSVSRISGQSARRLASGPNSGNCENGEKSTCTFANVVRYYNRVVCLLGGGGVGGEEGNNTNISNCFGDLLNGGPVLQSVVTTGQKKELERVSLAWIGLFQLGRPYT